MFGQIQSAVARFKNRKNLVQILKMAFAILNETDTSERSEMQEIVRQMERGTVVTPFLQKKNPDKWNLCIRDESRQLICYKPSRSSGYEEIGTTFIHYPAFIKKNMIFVFYIRLMII